MQPDSEVIRIGGPELKAITIRVRVRSSPPDLTSLEACCSPLDIWCAVCSPRLCLEPRKSSTGSGVLSCLDGYMKHRPRTDRGICKRSMTIRYGDAFICGNNGPMALMRYCVLMSFCTVLFISAADPYELCLSLHLTQSRDLMQACLS
jgi:hypothetical protein